MFNFLPEFFPDRAKHIERKVLNECAEETEDLKCKLKDQEQVKDALCSEYQQRIEVCRSLSSSSLISSSSLHLLNVFSLSSCCHCHH